jgi:hypothetical protein
MNLQKYFYGGAKTLQQTSGRTAIRRYEMKNPQIPLEWPEAFLWVRHPDHTLTVIEPERLQELLDGATPEDETERVLAGNRVWSRICLLNAIGLYVIEIPAGGPLPEWDDTWLVGKRGTRSGRDGHD